VHVEFSPGWASFLLVKQRLLARLVELRGAGDIPTPGRARQIAEAQRAEVAWPTECSASDAQLLLAIAPAQKTQIWRTRGTHARGRNCLGDRPNTSFE
jgi:hypothetical protein